MVYWCNSYTIVHFSLDIIEWFKYKLKKVFKLYLILIHPPLSIDLYKLEETYNRKELQSLPLEKLHKVHKFYIDSTYNATS